MEQRWESSASELQHMSSNRWCWDEPCTCNDGDQNGMIIETNASMFNAVRPYLYHSTEIRMGWLLRIGIVVVLVRNYIDPCCDNWIHLSECWKNLAQQVIPITNRSRLPPRSLSFLECSNVWSDRRSGFFDLNPIGTSFSDRSRHSFMCVSK